MEVHVHLDGGAAVLVQIGLAEALLAIPVGHHLVGEFVGAIVALPAGREHQGLAVPALGAAVEQQPVVLLADAPLDQGIAEVVGGESGLAEAVGDRQDPLRVGGVDGLFGTGGGCRQHRRRDRCRQGRAKGQIAHSALPSFRLFGPAVYHKTAGNMVSKM